MLTESPWPAPPCPSSSLQAQLDLVLTPITGVPGYTVVNPTAANTQPLTNVVLGILNPATNVATVTTTTGGLTNAVAGALNLGTDKVSGWAVQGAYGLGGCQSLLVFVILVCIRSLCVCRGS